MHKYNKIIIMIITMKIIIIISEIKVRSHGECEPLVCHSYMDLQGPWWNYRFTSLCANDGRTYGHIRQVRCLKHFHPGELRISYSLSVIYLIINVLHSRASTELKVLHEGGCSLYEVRKILGRNLKRKACAEKVLSYEKNPICTQNNVTYANPFETLCTRPPGGAREKVGGVCGSPAQRACEKVLEIQRMIKESPGDRDKYLVCGNDMRTYRSQYHLECSSRFNISE